MYTRNNSENIFNSKAKTNGRFEQQTTDFMQNVYDEGTICKGHLLLQRWFYNVLLILFEKTVLVICIVYDVLKCAFTWSKDFRFRLEPRRINLGTFVWQLC